MSDKGPRHHGVAGSISTSAIGPLARKGQASDFEFNLGQTKSKVLKGLDDTVPVPFKRFFNSALYDRLLQTSLLYFAAKFMHEWIVRAMDKARKMHLEGYNPYQVAMRLNELEEEMHHYQVELSPVYSEIILKYSTFQKPQQDRMFFESMYSTLITIIDEAFGKVAKRDDIDADLGLLFRSKHFNINQRKLQPARSVDTLSVKELYSIKHETSNRALNAKMLSSLYEKPPTLGVQVASVTNSPLITQYIMSPIVARSMLKDPEQRREMFSSLKSSHSRFTTLKQATATQQAAAAANAAATAAATGGGGASQQASRAESPNGGEQPMTLSTVFKGAALLQGVNPATLKRDLATMKPSPETSASIGIMPEERGYRSQKAKPPSGVLAPETAGLPADDAFNHLALLKRYVLYGPTLGLQQQQPGAPGAGGFASHGQMGSVAAGTGAAGSRDTALSPAPAGSAGGTAPSSRGGPGAMVSAAEAQGGVTGPSPRLGTS